MSTSAFKAKPLSETHLEDRQDVLPPPVQEGPSEFEKVLNDILCGAFAGVLAKTAVAPAERVKMSFQITKDRFSISAAMSRAGSMVSEAGVASLWRGHSSTVLRVAPFAGFSYAFHDYAEKEFKRELQVDRLPFMYKFTAGAFGGGFATLLTYPLDVLRVRLALLPGATWASTIRQGGLFQGLVPTMLGIIPYSGTSWTVKQFLSERYNHHFNPLKQDRRPRDGCKDEKNASMYQGKSLSMEKVSPNMLESLIMNAIAGLSGQFVTYPLDIVRRRMQMRVKTPGAVPMGMVATLKELVASEGIRGLGKGFTLNILKGPITMSISLTAYDLLQKSKVFNGGAGC